MALRATSLCTGDQSQECASQENEPSREKPCSSPDLSSHTVPLLLLRGPERCKPHLSTEGSGTPTKAGGLWAGRHRLPSAVCHPVDPHPTQAPPAPWQSSLWLWGLRNSESSGASFHCDLVFLTFSEPGSRLRAWSGDGASLAGRSQAQSAGGQGHGGCRAQPL